ncbi:amino acid permease [Legionella yabuuchiae]|uniref:amino acid permease n=1 Tax=Legionella yabuuchiae TaxID=376727 RepID=UPI001056816B|nr:amino acid permease [Legionella yabuuchiae]
MSSDASIAIPLTVNTIDLNRKHNTTWMLSLYGTAIGAGTLFLPIDAGLNGILPLIIMTLLAFPMTYFSHQALCRFVLSGSGEQTDITDVVDQHFGEKAGKLLTYLYFFSIFPILLMYSVALTNTTQSFIANQMHLPTPPRALISLLLIIGLMLIIRMGQHMVIKAMSFLVYPFIMILVMLSLYLVPHWNGAIFHYQPVGHNSIKSLLMSLWLLIPVVIFSFNHSPIISSFAVSQKKRYGENAAEKSSGILKATHLLMIATVMFFVFSCVLSLSPENLAEAKQQNISILSYLANHFHTPLIAYIAPIIAFLAIAKSYLGHYLGASEGLAGMINKSLKKRNKTLSTRTLDIGIDLFIILTCWIIATINPNILTLIETLGGPIIAIFLFIMPMYAIKTVPSMKQYRKPLANAFTAFVGLIALSAILYGLEHTLGA